MSWVLSHFLADKMRERPHGTMAKVLDSDIKVTSSNSRRAITFTSWKYEYPYPPMNSTNIVILQGWLRY